MTYLINMMRDPNNCGVRHRCVGVCGCSSKLRWLKERSSIFFFQSLVRKSLKCGILPKLKLTAFKELNFPASQPQPSNIRLSIFFLIYLETSVYSPKGTLSCNLHLVF